MKLYVVFDGDRTPLEIFKFPPRAIQKAEDVSGTIEIWELNEEQELS